MAELWQNKTLGFLGAGNMAYGILSGVLKVNLIPSSRIYAADIVEVCRQNFSKHGTHTFDSGTEVVKVSDVIIIAVKPQQAADLLSSMKETIVQRKPLLISIMAGKTTDWIKEQVGVPDLHVVRVMPNLALTIGEGVSLVHASKGCTVEDYDRASSIFGTAGIVEKIENEDEIDNLTAITGCSPGYLFYFIESLTEAGVRAGISHDLSERLAVHAIAGAGNMAKQLYEKPAGEKKTPSELREMVCSRGGSTVKGIDYMKEHKMTDIVAEGARASMDRNRELAKL
eukprot:TRINITY_DN2722_c0_g1_i1.p1 TRINITY_DN2722_c0_g1~~TRINITY_DN2722_c0_g1_i1.p1  ORF type:complete len:284 (+),score=64.85 TRINITY_DN2722_c0_g1_i1:63-914(+)